MPEELSWHLRAYTARRIRSDWSKVTPADYEWADTLALCIDKFARDWVAANCPGRPVKATR